MTSAELRAAAARRARGRTADSLLEQSSVAIAGALAIVAVVALGVVSYHEPVATIAREVWDGSRMLHAHAIPVHFGIETATLAGTAGASIGWLTAIFVALSVRIGGNVGPLVLVLVALCGALAIADERMRRYGVSLPLRLAALSAMAAATGGIRASEALLAFVAALTVTLLDRFELRPRRVVALVGLAIVGFNLSPYAAILPALGAAATAAALAADRRMTDRVRALLWTSVAMAAASFATPALADLPFRYASIMGWTGTELADSNPASFPAQAYRFGFVPIALAALWFGLRSKRAAGAAAFAVCAALAAFCDAHWLGIAAIVAVPALAASVVAQIPASRQRVASLAAIGVCIVLTGVLTVDRKTHRAPTAIDPALAASLDRMVRDGKTHRIFCTTAALCDAVVARNVRTLSVYMDARPGYPGALRTRASDVASGTAGWRKTLRDAKIDTLVLDTPRAFATLVSLSPGWQLAASSHDVAVYQQVGR